MGAGKLMLEKECLVGRVRALDGLLLEKEWECQAAQTEMAELRAQLAALSEENETLKAKVIKHKEKRAALKTHIYNLKIDIENEEHDKLRAEDDPNQERTRTAELEALLHAIGEKQHLLMDQLEEAQDAADVLEGQLNDANATIEQLMAAQEPQPLTVDDELVIDGASGIDFEDMDVSSDGDNHAA